MEYFPYQVAIWLVKSKAKPFLGDISSITEREDYEDLKIHSIHIRGEVWVSYIKKTLAKGGYDHESKIWSWNGPNGKSIEDDLWERRENVSLIVIPTTKFELSSAPGTRWQKIWLF